MHGNVQKDLTQMSNGSHKTLLKVYLYNFWQQFYIQNLDKEISQFQEHNLAFIEIKYMRHYTLFPRNLNQKLLKLSARYSQLVMYINIFYRYIIV